MMAMIYNRATLETGAIYVARPWATVSTARSSLNGRHRSF